MTPERFTDWLQGFVEIQQSESITDTQWLIIKDHLKLVFDKKTPDRSYEVSLSQRIKPGFNWDILDKQTQWEKWHIPAATC